MVVIYDFVCDECGLSIESERMSEHAYSTGHRYYKDIGNTDGP